MDKQQYTIYDEIVANTFNGVVYMSNEENNQINLLYNNNINSKFLLKMCFMVQDIYNTPIFISTNIITYFKIKVKNHGRNIKYIFRSKIKKGIVPDEMVNVICNFAHQDSKIIEKILSVYYTN